MSLREVKNRGYWTVGDREFDNKVKAILFAQDKELDFKEIHYHYNDMWWDQHDWSMEPPESLQELYVRRARQLRDQYDTLILRFSGGADSYNILKIFIDNDIKIDVITTSVWALGDPDNTIIPNNIEKEKLVFPVIKELQNQGADFEFIVSDISPLMSNVGNSPDWFMRIDAPKFSVVDVSTHLWTTLPEYKKWDNDKTCYIVGVDKPQIWCKHDKIWFWSINDVLHTMHNQVSNMIPEPFYWTADMPEIPIKQSHEIKNYYRKRQNLMLSNQEDPTTKHIISKKSRFIPIIYPTYYSHVNPQQDTLPYYDMTEDGGSYRKENNLAEHSPRGMGQDRLIHLSPYYDIWMQGIAQADALIDRRFKNRETIWEGGLRLCWSKPRWLGN